MEDTKTRLTALLVEQLGVRADQCTDDALLVPAHDDLGRQLDSHREHLGCDSLDVVELVMRCEEHWGIEISDFEAEPLNEGTVADLRTIIESKLVAKAA